MRLQSHFHLELAAADSVSYRPPAGCGNQQRRADRHPRGHGHLTAYWSMRLLADYLPLYPKLDKLPMPGCVPGGEDEGGGRLPAAGGCLHLLVCPAGAKMLDHCNAYDTPFYVNLKSSLKKKQAIASEQQQSGSQREASEQQARAGSTAAQGGVGVTALRAVGSALEVSLPAVSSSPGKAKGKEAMSQQSSQVSPMLLCGLGALLGVVCWQSPLNPF